MIWKKGTLSKDKLCLKSCYYLGFQSSNIYEFDLSNEVPCVLVDKEAAKYQRSKLKVEKNLPDQPSFWCISLETGWVSNFLSTSNFDLWYFCSLVTYKAYSTSFERSNSYLFEDWKPGTWHDFQHDLCSLKNTLISYHTEAFVKTEVGCTVFESVGRVKNSFCLEMGFSLT